MTRRRKQPDVIDNLHLSADRLLAATADPDIANLLRAWEPLLDVLRVLAGNHQAQLCLDRLADRFNLDAEAKTPLPDNRRCADGSPNTVLEYLAQIGILIDALLSDKKAKHSRDHLAAIVTCAGSAAYLIGGEQAMADIIPPKQKRPKLRVGK